MDKLLIYYLVVVNLLSLMVYGWDKLKARRGRWRISERTLLALAFFGGSLGAWMGIKLWRHKTQHWQFAVGVPLMLALHLVLLYCFYGR